jgi:phytanoyl-CoA hydroxylase
VSAEGAPKPHHLNVDFHWSDHVGPFSVITDEQARSYDELGYFVLEDAFPPELIDQVAAEIDPFEFSQEEQLRTFKDGRYFIARADEITFTTHLVTRSDLLRRFCGSPLLAGLCGDLIGPEVRLYWDQAVYKKPDTAAVFPWHQDNGYAFVRPQQYLTCWIALTDATVENGCPWVVPGLHRGGTLAHRYSDAGFVCLSESDDAVAVPTRRGSIAVFSSLTPHSTGPNLTDQVRKAYIVQFAPDGAYVVQADAEGGLTQVPANDERRQFATVRSGAPVLD